MSKDDAGNKPDVFPKYLLKSTQKNIKGSNWLHDSTPLLKRSFYLRWHDDDIEIYSRSENETFKNLAASINQRIKTIVDSKVEPVMKLEQDFFTSEKSSYNKTPFAFMNIPVSTEQQRIAIFNEFYLDWQNSDVYYPSIEINFKSDLHSSKNLLSFPAENHFTIQTNSKSIKIMYAVYSSHDPEFQYQPLIFLWQPESLKNAFDKQEIHYQEYDFYLEVEHSTKVHLFIDQLVNFCNF